jgi:exosortase/archaeosortase family protein
MATALAGAAALVVAQHAAFRRLEAAVAAGILRLTGGHGVTTLGANVLFSAKQRSVGIRLDAGCSAAFLVAPFLLLGAGLLLTGRVSVRRALGSVALTATLVFLVNQLRLLVIAVAIRSWGLDQGYERSHVLLGTVVSTIGVLVGMLAFFKLAARGPRPEAPRHG